MKTADDRELFSAYVRKGDVDALGKLVVNNAAWLKAFLRAMLPDREIEDVFQDVWIRIIKSAADYHGGEIKPFILTIAKRAVADRLRKVAKIRNFEEMDKDDVMSEIPAQSPTPLELAEISITSDQVRRCIRMLPLPQREIILMRLEGGLICEEIARELSIPLNTVLTRIYRATQSLKKMLGVQS